MLADDASKAGPKMAANLQIRISIIGSRGIPAKYGGFEVFTEELSTRLVKHGYDVTVCCEYPLSEKLENYKGVNLRYFPFPPPKSYFLRKIYEIMNDVFFIAVSSRSCDIMYILGVGTAGWCTFLPKLVNRKIRILVNIDGLEWKRDKFSKLEKIFLKINNNLAIRFSNAVILDSRSLTKYIEAKWHHKTIFIPYGVAIPEKADWKSKGLEILLPINENAEKIKAEGYWLVVARLEPENNIHTIFKGFLASTSKKPLVVVGNASSEKYGKELSKIILEDKTNRIIMVGAVYNNIDLLNMFRQNCFAYIHGHSVGGTNPSLLEAMAMKNIILAHDNEFNREVCEDSCLFFRNVKELTDCVELAETNRYLHLKDQAYHRVKTQYSWDELISTYDLLMKKLMETSK